MQIHATVMFRRKRYFAKSLDKNFDPHNFGEGGGGKNMFSDVLESSHKILIQKYL